MSSVGLGVLILAAAGAFAAFGTRPVGDLPPGEFALVLALAGVGVVLAGWSINEFRIRWTEGVRALVVWSVVYAGVVAAYVQRDQLEVVLDRAIGEVSPGRPAVNAAGEVVVARRANGSFTLAGRVNDREARFLFDTGASTVVLTAESAAAAGFRPENLTYSIPVMTANGGTLAAPITLESLSVGPIVQRKVRAMVARPGALSENLLGMTFLDRLASYEVRGNRLILRPGAS
jgi:aspartyl protease family protein